MADEPQPFEEMLRVEPCGDGVFTTVAAAHTRDGRLVASMAQEALIPE